MLLTSNMAHDYSISVTVGFAYNSSFTVHIGSRARERCAFLRTLSPGAILPNVHVKPFRIILSHLSGEDCFATPTIANLDTYQLLLFARTWALAARMGLPVLQNKLVAAMRIIYMEAVNNALWGEKVAFPADKTILRAFRHLHQEIGQDSEAENFLVCFMGRTTPSIPDLKRQLKQNGFDRKTSEALFGREQVFRVRQHQIQA